MSRLNQETSARLRQAAAFLVLSVTAYLSLATSCNEGSNVEISSTLPVRFSAGQSQLLLEVEMTGAYVELTSDGPLLFSPPPPEAEDDALSAGAGGVGGAGGASEVVPPPPEATMTYCWNVTVDPTLSPELGECVRLPNSFSKTVRFLAERQGDTSQPATLTLSATVHSGLSCSSNAQDSNGNPELLTLRLQAVEQ